MTAYRLLVFRPMQSRSYPQQSIALSSLPPPRPRPPRSGQAMSAAERRIREMTRPSPATILVTMVAGALAGTATGIIAGPLGAGIGALVGALVGASTGVTIEFREAVVRRHDARLDREIGVDGGDLGRR